MRTALTILLFFASIAIAQTRVGRVPVLRSVRLHTSDNRPLPGQSKLNAALNSHLGRPADEAELGRLADIVIEHLRQRHWPVTLVTVWDEDGGLAKGDVTLQVQQGSIGKIGVKGGSKRRQLAVARQLADLPGKPLDGLALQRRIDALSYTPWLAVSAQASPTGALATADLMLTLHDQRPVEVFASYENNGVAPLGENRYTLGFEWLDAFTLGQDLTLTGTIADDPRTLHEFTANWRIPLPWHHELRFSGYYAESHSLADLLGIPFDEDGVSWQASVRYVIPWRMSDHWRSEWSVGYDYKQFNNEFIFGGTASSPIPVGVGTAVIGTLFMYDTVHDHVRFGMDVVHGGKGWAENETEHPYNDLSPGAKPDFTILRGAAAYEHNFSNDVQTSLRVSGQWADGPLLASEELPLASVYAVRGYPERSVLASRGGWASLEVRSPAWHHIRAVAFTDAGISGDPDQDTKSIASAGIGLRGEITKHFQFRCEGAYPFTDHLGPRLHVAAVLRL